MHKHITNRSRLNMLLLNQTFERKRKEREEEEKESKAHL